MREVNERILEINDEFRSKEPVLVVCECCRSARYVLALGHEDEEFERVLDRRTRYAVVDDVGSG
jgi:hypothetical protein